MLDQSSASRQPERVAANRLPERLRQWTIAHEDAESGAADDGPKLWRDGKGFDVRRIASQDQAFRLQFRSSLAVDLYFDRRLIVDRSNPPAAADAFDHLLSNQVAPRIIAHGGELVLHASAVLVGQRALLMLGESGSGKSTLAASFERNGDRLVADDGIIVRASDGEVLAEPVQSSLRLRGDSYSALYGTAAPEPGAGGKLRIPIDAGCPTDTAHGVAAMFVLQPAAAGARLGVSRLSAADACIGLVTNSFELDPTDMGRTAAKLARAAAVAGSVPVFALTCPRDFARLAEIRSAMLGAVQ